MTIDGDGSARLGRRLNDLLLAQEGTGNIPKLGLGLTWHRVAFLDVLTDRLLTLALAHDAVHIGTGCSPANTPPTVALCFPVPPPTW